MTTNLNNVNINYLPPDCMAEIFVLSEESPAELARVCKAWQNHLEVSYPWIAALYGKDPRILPFMPLICEPNIGKSDVQRISKLIVQQTYRRIVEGFLNAPHIKKHISELGLKINPLAILSGTLSTLSVAEDSNLVKSFEPIFRGFAIPSIFSPSFFDGSHETFIQSLKVSCEAIGDHVSLASFGILQQIDEKSGCNEVKDKALCIRHWIAHNPEILNQQNVCIDIQCLHLTILPLEVLSFPHITVLNLSDNHLNTLPDAITTLSELKTLNLCNNKLTSIPKIIFKISSLRFLKLEHNEISHLPTTICQLSELKYLDIADNKLTSLPKEFCQLSKLECLAISDNKLTSLPKEFLHLSNLVSIDINNNNLSFGFEAVGTLRDK